MVLWVEFFALMIVIFFSGKNLVKYGDILAEKLNIGRTIIGLVFIASITSLPELVTGISSVAVVQAPNLLAGDIFGSCMANLLILALLDMFVKKQPLTAKVHHGFTLTVSFGILLICIAVLSILLKNQALSLGWISVNSILIMIVYIFAIKITSEYEKRILRVTKEQISEKLRYQDQKLKDVVFKYLFNSFIIVVSASLLPERGEKIVHTFGLSETFFGSFFIAVTTSLPELAVSVAAIKLNLVQIAVANLLGSNIFNIFIMAIADFFYTDNPIYIDIHLSALIPAVFAVIMACVVVMGLIYKAEKKFFVVSNESILLIVLYLLGIYLTYLYY